VANKTGKPGENTSAVATKSRKPKPTSWVARESDLQRLRVARARLLTLGHNPSNSAVINTALAALESLDSTALDQLYEQIYPTQE
jgi:hypothetical protein